MKFGSDMIEASWVIGNGRIDALYTLGLMSHAHCFKEHHQRSRHWAALSVSWAPRVTDDTVAEIIAVSIESYELVRLLA